MEAITFIWNNVLINPMTNILVVLNNILFGSFGMAIIVFTIIMRVVTFPLTLRQLHSSRAMAAIQPRLMEIKKKYKDPKRQSEETMKLYREAGVNPLGCMVQMVVQMPIWIALYQVIRLALGSTPEALIGLRGHLYPWSYIQHAVPLSNEFLWLDLSQPDLLLALLVGLTMFVQQKITTVPTTDERQQSMSSTMLWMMPLMFSYFALNVPSGLPLYWFLSAVVSIILQQMYVGSSLTWRTLFTLQPAGLPRTAVTERRPAKLPDGQVPPVEVEEEEPPLDRRYKKRSRHGKRRRKR